MKLLQQLSTEIGDLFSAVLPSIVTITCWVKEKKSGVKRIFSSDGLFESSGAGVVLRSDGVIITNAHIVEDALRIQVRLNDNRVFEPLLVKADDKSDVAVLKIPTSDLCEAQFAIEREPVAGEIVIAVGHPIGFHSSVTLGIVSSPSRFFPEWIHPSIFIQTDAAINRGNSGGALVGSDGKVIGIPSWGKDNREATNISFAIPIKHAIQIADELLEYGKVKYGWIGLVVDICDLPAQVMRDHSIDQATGICVVEVESPSYAFEHHLDEGYEIVNEIIEGDIILKMGDEPVINRQEYMKIIMDNIGCDLKLTMLRGNETIYYSFIKVEDLSETIP